MSEIFFVPLLKCCKPQTVIDKIKPKDKVKYFVFFSHSINIKIVINKINTN